MKKILLTASFLALMACTASAEGLNLGWSDCPTGAPTYHLDENFACNTNTGVPHILVGTYIPPAGLNTVNGNQIVLDLQTDQTALSPWWTMGSNGCTGRTLTPSADFNFASGPFSCVDYWAGQASGGINYILGQGGPNRARMSLICAIQENLAGPQDASTEYYSFKVTITNARTVGSPSCAGCTDKVCIVLNSILITQNPPDNVNQPTVSIAAQSNYVTWRGGLTPDCQATPAKQSTWGSVKALYR